MLVRIILVSFFKLQPIFSASNKFPDDFQFGIGTSAYQIEGGYDSRGETAFDYYQGLKPTIIGDSSNASVACDSYHRYQEDIELVADLGVDFYRFSIAWSRILPMGHPNQTNPDGIRYYNNLIDGLLAKKIQPVVTIYHGDLPKPLQDLGGWTNPQISDIFEDYARILFQNFGDRVKTWITLNVNLAGLGDDEHPPMLNQPGIGEYLAAKTIVLSHAKAFRLYEREFRREQGGKVGLVVDGFWYEAGSQSPQDLEAAQRVREFKINLLLNPIYGSGDFPKLVKDRVGDYSRKEDFFKSRLPRFSSEEVEFIKGTYDFLGLNIYSTNLVKNGDHDSLSVDKDMGAVLYQDPKWSGAKSPWLKTVPWGCRNLLKWVNARYNNPDIFVTENGFSDDGQLEDLGRINFLQLYLKAILEAIHEDGVQVKWYSAWSLLDNFEWLAGYSEKFGLYHVDFTHPNRTRTPKLSSKWYKNLIRRRHLDTTPPKTEL